VTNPNTNIEKENLMASKKTIEQVWDKAKTIRGKSSNTWRRDSEGN